MLVAKGITKRFDRLEILRGIDLEVGKGETLAIVGASGEGKSTLLHILGTLETATSGTLEIMGSKAGGAKMRNRQLGFIFQSFYLMEDYDVLANVMMPAKIARRDAKERATELLEKVGLSHRLHHPAKLLSGGEKQRVAIARALCNNPPLIFADEPSGNLDHKTSEAIHELLFGLVGDEGKTLIIVTHDRALAAKCDRTCTLQDGVLV